MYGYTDHVFSLGFHPHLDGELARDRRHDCAFCDRIGCPVPARGGGRGWRQEVASKWRLQLIRRAGPCASDRRSTATSRWTTCCPTGSPTTSALGSMSSESSRLLRSSGWS